MTRIRSSTLAFSLLLAGAPAQRLLVVDRAGGPGVFADLPPAEAAAADGDTILIRQHALACSRTVTGKALKIVGANQPRIDALVVTGLAQGREFVLDGVAIWNGLSLQSNLGRVVLHDLQVNGSEPSLQIAQCQVVCITSCFITGVSCVASAVEISLSSLVTGFARVPALDTNTSVVQVSWTGIYSTVYTPYTPPIEGIVQNLGSLELDATTEVVAGVGTAPAAAIRTNGLLTLDPATHLVPNGTAPAIQGGTVSVRPMSSVVMEANLQMGVLGGNVLGPANGVAITLASPTHDPLPTSLGLLWVRPTAAVVDVGLLPGGRRRITLSLPQGIPLGTTVVFQSAIVAGNTVSLSIPSVLCLN